MSRYSVYLRVSQLTVMKRRRRCSFPEIPSATAICYRRLRRGLCASQLPPRMSDHHDHFVNNNVDRRVRCCLGRLLHETLAFDPDGPGIPPTCPYLWYTGRCEFTGMFTSAGGGSSQPPSGSVQNFKGTTTTGMPNTVARIALSDPEISY
ncbi:uncharacterized protein BP01DRAFT_178025 [Aspergillus saccharolyticus JOP 1030-1]|uniref:Uncharacterized protein n=1 Tax=Aspergillus saccharolyticus JOP 1030-1 TaxID=1450539 RepID=A0A318ZNW0_9EURO|nr:hypothetical protein BP01DRAFT_178025 [Aspergillus saccharolyticus JOP 1030-1]PYH48214.1 hypothetical protein BP01DRAFT_178025 [Aspergillus saccharolyticus JOP 1030-1]